MQVLRLAVATRRFGQPLKIALKTAGQIGAQGVQLDTRDDLKPAELSATGRRQFLSQLSEWRLSVASLNFPNRRSFCDLEYLEMRVTAVKDALRFAHELKASVVTARLGRVPDDADSDEYRVLRDVLNDLARHANHVGAVFAVTPAGDSPDRIAQILAEVTEGPIGINFDPAQWVMDGHDPAAALRALHARASHIQVRDALRDMEGGQEVPVGRGEVKWDELLALIDEMAYHGWLTIDRTTGDDRLGDMAQAANHLREVITRG